MALKITTQIGTNKGITSEAYIRISKYTIDKAGYGKFNLQIFQKEDFEKYYTKKGFDVEKQIERVVNEN